MNAPAHASAGARPAVEIRPFRPPARFLDLQRRFYRDDPHYVPPIASAEAWQIDPRKNPWFQHGEAEFLVAWRGQQPVGRISAARDHLHDEFHGDRVGFFGHFEATDEAVAHALLDAAARWLRARGATELRGPIDLSTNYRCGLLVEGEPGPPVVMMPHNPLRYAGWLESYGLAKAKDLLALMVLEERVDHDRLHRVAARLQRKSGVTLRPLDLSRFEQELDVLTELYHRIWERNWGFAPMSGDEFRAQARDLKRLAHPAVLPIAELDGRAVAFAVALPDVNIAARACNGRLLPFGWWKLLRALRRTRRIRTITLGVLPEHRRSGIQLLLLHSVITKGIAAGFNACEASWILEDNHDMLGPLETLGGYRYRRYRIYTRTLA